MVRCGGELHQVDQLFGMPVYGKTTICEKCHHVTEYNKKGVPVARNIDARKKARALADELDRSGVLVEADGPRRIAVALEGKHWKVRAVNGAYLYSFSTTPSDHRSIQNTVSALRKMNVRWGEEAEKIVASNGDRAKHHAPPSDTELTPVQERGIAVRARLSTLQKALGATNTDLVRVGMDAAKKRKLWHYKTVESGVVQIGRFLSGKTYGDGRSLDFFEAMCDELEGVPAKQFGTATEPALQAVPAPAAHEPEPEPEPVPVAPDPPQMASMQKTLEARDQEIIELKAELATQDAVVEGLRTDLSAANNHVRSYKDANGRLADTMHSLKEDLEAQRSATLSAEAMARSLQTQLDERPTAGADDPLFIKALRRLVTNSSTDQEIEEAFEMAMQIYRGGS